MAWTTFRLRVVTPLFSGDDAEGGDPIRVPSIRGALRFWFRAVAAGHGVTDLVELWNQEEAVFGSTRKPSPIALRVRNAPKPSHERRPQWAVLSDGKDCPEIAYLLGLGLWKPGTSNESGLQRQFVKRGSFDLDVRFGGSEEVNCRFMHALWAWLTFGGLGARTRRGFGQLQVENTTGNFPGLWEEQHLRPPGTEAGWRDLFDRPWVREMEEVNDHGWRQSISAEQTGQDHATSSARPSEELPEWPMLRAPWWRGRLLGGNQPSLQAALTHAGKEWRSFMLTRTAERGLSTPEWMNAIIGTDDRFPRAVLGLPVTYYRKPSGDQSEFKTTVQADGGELRRASPVWLRPVQSDKGSWSVVTFVFRCRLLPGGTQLTADQDAHDKQLDVPDEAAAIAWSAWMPPQGPTRRRLPADYYKRD
jgi:CRISPR-associated protein Cmr1